MQRSFATLTSALVAAILPLAALTVEAGAAVPKPILEGRAVLPVETYAPGPPAGTFFAPSTINGISFPLPSQPVEGFSGVIDGREPGEYLAMADNGFGSKANSRDFLIRAYFIRPDFKTVKGGTGAVTVRDYIEFRDPGALLGFPIVNQQTNERLLTGGDIDPESIQRAKNGDLWVGDEFGPWLLHFDSDGVLLDPPFPMPGGLQSPNNPFLAGPATQPNSRGIEAMAISPNGMNLYAVLEGPTVADSDKTRRLVFEFSIEDEAFTGRTWQYHMDRADLLVADIAALDQHRLILIERDLGSGVNALVRKLTVVDLRQIGTDGFLDKAVAVDLAAIPDPDLVSLPPLHAGDVGLGPVFQVTCESIEAVHVLDGERALLACDNNFPNKARNPGLPDDNELIVVKVPGLKTA